jgi:hypothetical protein
MDEPEHESKVRERIASFVQSDAQVQKKELANSEVQALQSAAGRLDQLLADREQAEVNLLLAASSRLDQLLAQIGAGKDVAVMVVRQSEEPADHESVE